MEFFQSDKPTEIKIEFFWEEIGLRSSSIVVIRIMCRTVLYHTESKHFAEQIPFLVSLILHVISEAFCLIVNNWQYFIS